MLIIGEDELRAGQVMLKDVGDREKKDEAVSRETVAMVAAVNAVLQKK